MSGVVDHKSVLTPHAIFRTMARPIATGFKSPGRLRIYPPVWLLSEESNLDHEGMNLICYLCTTQLFIQAHIKVNRTDFKLQKFTAYAQL